MNLVPSWHFEGDSPVLVELTFPKGLDFPGEGKRQGAELRNPRGEWKSLASEKARELGIDIGFREVEGGLKVAFRSQDQCARVMIAMESEWPKRLKEGLRYWVGLTFRMAGKGSTNGDTLDPRPDVERIAHSYGLSAQDIQDLCEPGPQP